MQPIEFFAYVQKFRAISQDHIYKARYLLRKYGPSIYATLMEYPTSLSKDLLAHLSTRNDVILPQNLFDEDLRDYLRDRVPEDTAIYARGEHLHGKDGLINDYDDMYCKLKAVEHSHFTDESDQARKLENLEDFIKRTNYLPIGIGRLRKGHKSHLCREDTLFLNLPGVSRLKTRNEFFGCGGSFCHSSLEQIMKTMQRRHSKELKIKESVSRLIFNIL